MHVSSGAVQVTGGSLLLTCMVRLTWSRHKSAIQERVWPCAAAQQLVAMVRSVKTDQQQGPLPEQDCLYAPGLSVRSTCLQAECIMLRGLIRCCDHCKTNVPG